MRYAGGAGRSGEAGTPRPLISASSNTLNPPRFIFSFSSHLLQHLGFLGDGAPKGTGSSLCSKAEHTAKTLEALNGRCNLQSHQRCFLL